MIYFGISFRRFALICILLLAVCKGALGFVLPQDSLVNQIYLLAEHHAKIVRHYESELYIKGNVKLLKRNKLLEYVPQMFTFEKGVNEYIGESFNSLNYTAPFMYDRRVIAVYGTYPRLKKESNMILDYFNVNIYNESLVQDRLLSPFHGKNARFYSYRLDSIVGDRQYYTYKPRFYNTQLTSGSFVLNRHRRLVEQVTFEGKYEFITFHLTIKMGKEGVASYLPSTFNLSFKFNFAGNKMEGHYLIAQQYQKIELIYDPPNRRTRKHRHDLTDRYALSVDTAKFQIDSTLIAAYRFFPLSEHEQSLYMNRAAHRDSMSRRLIVPRKKSQVFWGKFGDALISNYTLNVPSIGSVRCSPIINPILFNYSKSSGYAYRQDFKYNVLMNNGKLFRIAPRIGYNFTHRELYWQVNSSFEYWPEKQARVEMKVGNGNRIYSSSVLEQIKNTQSDSLIFDKLHLDYFTDQYLTLEHKIDLVSGLTLTTGFTYHKRKPWKKSEIKVEDENIKQKYISFAPRVRIDYTPGLYYYWNGNRKINIYSPYPTLSLDWERGIKGLFGSDGVYERLEFEINYQLRIDPFRRFSYQCGAGMFTNQEHMYFVDFHNFSHHHLPEGWEDELGGVFQLLDRRWYNSSREYLRGHIIYESPLLLLSRMRGVTHVVQKERLYLNTLVMSHLHPYCEFGYGFATHVFDLGVFVASENLKYAGCGVKFTFELFNR